MLCWWKVSNSENSMFCYDSFVWSKKKKCYLRRSNKKAVLTECKVWVSKRKKGCLESFLFSNNQQPAYFCVLFREDEWGVWARLSYSSVLKIRLCRHLLYFVRQGINFVCWVRKLVLLSLLKRRTILTLRRKIWYCTQNGKQAIETISSLLVLFMRTCKMMLAVVLS